MLKRLDKWIARRRAGLRTMLLRRPETPTLALARAAEALRLTRPKRWDLATSKLAGLTPETIRAIFDNAGELLADQILLAADMEQADTDLAGTLRIRRAAVRRLTRDIQPGDPDDERSVAAGEALAELSAQGWWGQMEDWLLRACWLQHTGVEVLYAPRGRGQADWTPTGFRAVEPERYYVTEELEIQLYRDLSSATQNDLVAFEPGRLLHHSLGAVEGQPGRYADVRAAAKLWYFAHLNLIGWGKLIDKWGQPFTHFQYDAASVSNAELRTIVDTFLTLADQLVVATPTGVNVELKDPVEHTPNREFADFYARAMSRFLLGQETAQHATAGQETGATAQAQVRDDLRDEDAEALDDTLATQLIAPWCAWNYGEEVAPPKLRHVAEEALDQEQRGRVFVIAQQLGLPVRREQAYRELALETPGEDDELLGPQFTTESQRAQSPAEQGNEATGQPGDAEGRVPLSGIQITSAIDVLGKMTDGTLSNVVAVELLQALGFEAAAAAKMVSSQKLKTKDAGVEDVAFKRALLQQWIADGTISDVVYNATDILALLKELNVKTEPGYQAPWIPVQTPDGGVVTGEVLRDDEGDIVGGDVPIPTASPQTGFTTETQSAQRPEEQGNEATRQPGNEGETGDEARGQLGDQVTAAARGNQSPADSVTSAPSVPLWLNSVSGPVRTLAEQCSSLDEFRSRLTELAGQTADADDLDLVTFGTYCQGRLDIGDKVTRYQGNKGTKYQGNNASRGRPERPLVAANRPVVTLLPAHLVTVLADRGGPGIERQRYSEAIDAFAQRTDLLPKAEFLKLQGLNRARAWTVARVTDLAVMKDLHGAVGQAIEGGQSWREFKDSLDSIMESRGWAGLEPWHAQLVYAQNRDMAWSAGRAMQAQDSGLRYWRKLPSVSATPRPEHEALNGQVFALGQVDPPPWGFGCKCDWEVVFDDELEPEQRSAADAAQGTPREGEYEFRASDYFRPLELRRGEYPRDFWGLIESLASNANALLKLQH